MLAHFVAFCNQYPPGVVRPLRLLLPWSRTQESEADHLGLILMAKAGYDPHAALDLWRRMAEAAKGREHPPEFLSTHPSEATRIAQIEAWIPEAMQYYRPR